MTGLFIAPVFFSNTETSHKGKGNEISPLLRVPHSKLQGFPEALVAEEAGERPAALPPPPPPSPSLAVSHRHTFPSHGVPHIAFSLTYISSQRQAILVPLSPSQLCPPAPFASPGHTPHILPFFSHHCCLPVTHSLPWMFAFCFVNEEAGTLITSPVL